MNKWLSSKGSGEKRYTVRNKNDPLDWIQVDMVLPRNLLVLVIALPGQESLHAPCVMASRLDICSVEPILCSWDVLFHRGLHCTLLVLRLIDFCCFSEAQREFKMLEPGVVTCPRGRGGEMLPYLAENSREHLCDWSKHGMILGK